MPGGHEHYLKSKPKPKYPVGKVSGTDAHSYNGSHVMHVLVEHINEDRTTEWRLRCTPTKKGVYSYMGFSVAITCQRCKAGRNKGNRGQSDEAE